MINGSTKKVGVMGWPVSHTLSPLMHNAAFQAAGLNYIYMPLAVKPEELEQAVSGLKALGFAGANVTIPHKIKVMEYLDQIDRTAQLTGAVNTIVSRDGRLTGYNTDGDGFIASLKAHGVEVNGSNALLIGAGGSARAVACGLALNGVRLLGIAARNRTKAQELAAGLDEIAAISGMGFEDEAYIDALRSADVIINCTPLGMRPKTEEMPPVIWEYLQQSIVIYDLIYNPPETRLLAQARQKGHQAVNGLGMLVEQGAIAFELWTDETAPREVMYQAITNTNSD